MSRTHEIQKVDREVVVSTTCDCCGTTAGPDPDGWHHFDSYHRDWGSDSGESTRWHDACSWPCYLQIVWKIFADYPAVGDSTPTLTVDEKDWWFLRSMLDGTRGK